MPVPDFTARKRFTDSTGKGGEKERTGDYMSIDALDGFTETSNLEHAVKKHYRVLSQDQHTVFIQLRELVEQNTASKVSFAPQPTSVLCHDQSQLLQTK